jgi:hypothetical protein
LANIVAIWRAVAEDFAAFDVDITTEEPAAGVNIGSRAVIGGSSYDWYGAGAGGVAYVVSSKALRFSRVNVADFMIKMELEGRAGLCGEQAGTWVGYKIASQHRIYLGRAVAEGVFVHSRSLYLAKDPVAKQRLLHEGKI